MMMKKVIDSKPKGLLAEIKILEKQYDVSTVKEIQDKLLLMLDNYKDYPCLSQAYIDNLFGKWLKLSPIDKGHATAKKNFIRISEMMFVDNPKCIETGTGEEW